MQKLLLLISLFCWVAPSMAGIDVYEFDDPAQEAQFKSLLDQLRCPKCQNQSLASSDAPIAVDMKNKTYELLQQGYSEQEIMDYFVQRYGDFVSYRPPLRRDTWLLWFGPGLLLIMAAMIVWRKRARQGAETAPLSETEKQQLKNLLQGQENAQGIKYD